jgi:putative phage-type endonuclease
MKITDFEQGSEEWLNARIGVITGTRLKQVLGTQSKNLLYELIAECLAPSTEMGMSEAMERGSLYESDARMLYESTTGYDIETVGLCIHDEYDWLGSSPDGLYKENNKYVGAIEIKCPNTKTHIEYLVEKKIPSEYKAQVLQYFIVNDDLEWLDVVSYDPRIQLPEMQMSIVRVYRTDISEELDAAMVKLLAFRDKWNKLQDQYIF